MRALLACALGLVLWEQGGTGAFERGLAAFRDRDWHAAEAAFFLAVREAPKSASAWKFLGMTYAVQDRYEASLGPFRTACRLDPAEENACYYLGRACYRLSRYEESESAYNLAFKTGVNRARVHHGLALTLEALERAGEAESHFREASKGGDAEILTGYARFLEHQGRPAEALPLFIRAGAKAEAERLRRVLASLPAVRTPGAPDPVQFEAKPLPMIVRNGASGNKHQVETMLAGVAVFDYNGDGRPDIFVSNGAEIPSLRKTSPAFHDRLFRNNGDGTFTDVTDAAGVAGFGYSMGVAAGDYDNDGHIDLFVAGVSRNTLYHNLGNGTFEDVSASAGLIENGGWTIAAAWLDYDADGLLDLFVARYVTWDPATEPYCGDPRPGYRAYCHPRFYTALPNALYRNLGNGKFRDVSEESGIRAHPGKGMGVAIGDYDGDGRIDIFVANDTTPNFLFHNEGNGRFRERAVEVGVAFDENGAALSSMGCEFRDYDNDGREDIFVTSLTNERFVLFRNLGGMFASFSGPAHISAPSLPWSGWSAGAFDLNNDGFKDYFVANGNVMDNAELTSSRKSRQPSIAFLNRGDGTFEPQLLPGAAFHRGLAFGDFDRDGRMDAVITRLNESPLVLWNRTPRAGHWIAFELIGTTSNRDGIGARVRIETAAGAQWNRITTSNGFASSSSKIAHFGLGPETRVRSVEVVWPSGKYQKLADLAADQVVSIRER